MQFLAKNEQEWPINQPFWWRVAIMVSICLVLLLSGMWYFADSQYNPNVNQLISTHSAEAGLVVKLKEADQFKQGIKNFIPTGIFVQSLSFNNATDVNITGYVWQKYHHTEKLAEPQAQPGFIFPEAVDSGSNIKPKLIYEHSVGEFVTYGWYFETTLRQEFDYSKYPLDHKTVWIRIWSSNFQRTHYLLPALDDYLSTSPGAAFGLDKKIVLGSWDINETFYDYKITEYDTNFGLDQGSTHYAYPELYFNIVLKRKFLNSFIVEVVPLLTVAALMFSLLMTISRDPEQQEKMGFNVNEVIGVISALFFVVMLSHIHIREQFSSQGVVYIESFFLIMYLTMIVILCNTFVFLASKNVNVISIGDNFVMKVTFWPVLLSFMTIATYAFLF